MINKTRFLLVVVICELAYIARVLRQISEALL